MSADENLSAFSFLTSQSAEGVSPTGFDFISKVDNLEEIKLQKVAQLKTVKKKKKFTRVGCGRDLVTNEDESDSPTVTSVRKYSDISHSTIDDLKTGNNQIQNDIGANDNDREEVVHGSRVNYSPISIICESDSSNREYDQAETNHLESGVAVVSDHLNDVSTDFIGGNNAAEANSNEKVSFKNEELIQSSHIRQEIVLCKDDSDETALFIIHNQTNLVEIPGTYSEQAELTCVGNDASLIDNHVNVVGGNSSVEANIDDQQVSQDNSVIHDSVLINTAQTKINEESLNVTGDNTSSDNNVDERTDEDNIYKDSELIKLHHISSRDKNVNDDSADSNDVNNSVEHNNINKANEKGCVQQSDSVVDLKENQDLQNPIISISAFVTTNEIDHGNTIKNEISQSFVINTTTESTSLKNATFSDIMPTNGNLLPQNTMDHESIQNQSKHVVLEFTEVMKGLSTKHEQNLENMIQLKSNLLVEEQSIIMKQKRIAEVEKEQDDLALREEFEQADTLTSEMELMRNDIEIIKSNIINLNEEMIILSKEIHGYHNQCVKCVENALISLNLLKTQHDITFKQLKKEEIKETQRYDEEEKRMNLEKSYIDHEHEVLNEESKSIENSINNQCGERLMNVQQLTYDLEKVRNEIDELEKQLLFKKDTERKIISNLDELKIDINKVRKQHDRSLNRIQDRLVAVSKAKMDIENESTALKHERDKSMDKFRILTNSQLWINFYDSSLNVLEPFQKYLQDMCIYQPDHIDKDLSLEKLKQDVNQCHDLLNQSLEKEKSIQQNIRLLDQKHGINHDKIEKLEEEKLIYASSKKFKDAANTLSEIKLYQKENIIISDEKNILLLSLSNLNNDIINYRNEMEKSIILLNNYSIESQSKHISQRSQFQHQRIQQLDDLKSMIQKHNPIFISFSFGNHLVEIIKTVLEMEKLEESCFHNINDDDDDDKEEEDMKESSLHDLSESIDILSNKLESLVLEERYEEAASVYEEIEKMKLKQMSS